jgi:hypothetical protein
MTMRPATELKGIYQGHDIWVVGSGPSMDFIEAEFFANKVAIGINNVYLRFPYVSYLVRKEALRAEAAQASGIPVIISRHNAGSLVYRQNNLSGIQDYFVFEHADNHLDRVDLSVIGTDKIVVSWSTMTSALHLAAYMGAANVITAGHDCGTLDGRRNMAGYGEPPQGDGDYRAWLRKIEPQTAAVRERLRKVYGCRIYSLNPFLNFGLEGHRYER